MVLGIGLLIAALATGWVLRAVGRGAGPSPGNAMTIAVLPFENLGPADRDYFAAGMTGQLVVTEGEKGCTIHTKDGSEDVAAVTPDRIADPTGVGDAFRGGFMKGLAMGAPYSTCARLGSVAATYALEHLGGTSHAYTWDEFKRRYEAHFGPL